MDNLTPMTRDRYIYMDIMAKRSKDIQVSEIKSAECERVIREYPEWTGSDETKTIVKNWASRMTPLGGRGFHIDFS